MNAWLQRRKFRALLLLLIPAGILLTVMARNNPAFAENYATGLYLNLSGGVSRVTSLVPVSLAEILIFFVILAVILFLIYFIIRIIKRNNRKRAIGNLFFNLACVASVLYFLFTIDCGINYYRYTFAQTCGLEVKESSKQELITLCTNLAGDVNRLRKEVKTDSRDLMVLKEDNVYTAASIAEKSFDSIHTEYPLLRPGYGPPKPVMMSRMMSRLDISGMFFPFTFEANVNTDIPDYLIPVVMCHELSHLRGFMREDEANFIGYLVCENSKNTDFQYSGDMLAFTYASNALYSADAHAADSVFSTLSNGVHRDLAYNTAYWKQFEGPVAKVSNAVNDQYLKANRQQDGLKSYGRMVDLLLAEQRAKNGIK